MEIRVPYTETAIITLSATSMYSAAACAAWNAAPEAERDALDLAHRDDREWWVTSYSFHIQRGPGRATSVTSDRSYPTAKAAEAAARKVIRQWSKEARNA